MKRKLIALCMFAVLLCMCVLPGCTGKKTEAQQDEPYTYEQVSYDPEKLQTIIANNLFYRATANNGRVLRSETSTKDEESRISSHRVWMMDVHGNELASYTCESDDAYHISTLTATNDGGFLFVLGFSDYAYELGSWASDKGFASRVIKVDKNGKLQFDTSFDGVEGSALAFCLEKNGQFYFFGTKETPETKTQGVYSPTDVYMVILEKNGAVSKVETIAGSDYDQLDAAEFSDGAFLLSISAQSDDGDFEGSDSKGYFGSWVMTVNSDLEITGKEQKSGRGMLDELVGEKDGGPVYAEDDLLDKVDAGSVTALVDYKGHYLVVSENATGEYEKSPPMLNSKWYYTETVYSLYDDSGKLILRESVDSSPDFDAILEEFYSGFEPVA